MPGPITSPSTSTASNRQIWSAVAFLFLLAMAVRLPMLGQSLWYDEMYTLLHYVWAPWPNLFTDFSPNNHPVYSILAKLITSERSLHETILRLPSLLAGSALGVALAWPLRRTHPATALLIGLLASLQPWLCV